MKKARHILFRIFLLVVMLLPGCATLETPRECYRFSNWRDQDACRQIAKGQPLMESIDWEPNNFRVMTCGLGTIGVEKGIVPQDAMNYGLTKIIGLDYKKPYYDRILASAKSGIKKTGCIYLFVN